MPITRGSALLALVFASGSGMLAGQAGADLSVMHRIKVEAFQNSKVMDHLANLSDLYGPRLTASPEWEQAVKWATSELKGYGLANVHTETWGPFGKSWSIQSYTLDMLTPRYSHLVAVPLAWSSPTHGAETGEVVYAPFGHGRIFDPKKIRAEIDRYKTRWTGKLKGKIVLLTDAKQPKPATSPVFERYSDAQLAEIAKAPTPAVRRNITVDELDFPDDYQEAVRYFRSLPPDVTDEFYETYQNLMVEVSVFLKQEGVAGVIIADPRSHDGIVNAEAAGSYKSAKPMAAPTFIVTEEQYSRMQRLAEKRQPLTVRMDLQAKYSEADVDAANIIAEIPGQKKPDEVVMIGAHFDSWHSGTGATDNGAGSAVMMEVMRILKTVDVRLDRTVRLGLWSGEEQGLLGSKAYVKSHFADVKTGEVKPEQAKFDIYLNLDNGSGKIRGVYLEENDAIRPVFESLMAPFRDMDATTLSEKRTGGTDHMSFDAAGLPAFQFIQDPLDYETLTHHSDLDTYSHVVPEDLMQASAIIATLVYDFANRDELAPRKSIVRDGKLVNY